jgi:hypothetical protein
MANGCGFRVYLGRARISIKLPPPDELAVKPLDASIQESNDA